jgi:hypothetical protein
VQAGGAEDLELDSRDAITFLAKEMQKEAGKSQAPLKQDVLKVCFFLWYGDVGTLPCLHAQGNRALLNLHGWHVFPDL